ncbi:MAG: hypothetical protein HY481_02385 [Candidatus Vogelbacteria bacterium]|nr:hypothetical protein [Candidatus Vogelbacteria bacterium]
MINLLLSDYQQKLRADYRHRLFAVAGFLLLVWLLIILIIAVSLYWFVHLRRTEAEATLASVKNDTLAAAIEKQAAAIKEANILTKHLRAETTTVSPAAVIRRLTDRRGAITIREITYSLSPNAPPVVKLTGKSPTRQEFLVYLEALRTDPGLDEIDSPVRNLIQEKNLSFTLEVTIKSPRAPK